MMNSTKPLSFIQRQNIARQAAADRHEDRVDPEKVLIRQIRAELVGMSSASANARRVFEEANAPVAAPAAVRGHVHPTRFAALEAFIAGQGWSADPTAPVAPMPTISDIAGADLAAAQARLDAANAALVALSAGHDPDDADLPEPIEAPVTIETVESVEQPRRGRGRPPKSAFVDISAFETP